MKIKGALRKSSSIVWWGLAAVCTGVVLILVLLLVPHPSHVFTIVQKTEQNMVLVSARVGEIEVDFDDTPLRPHVDGTPPMEKMRRFLIQKRIGEARVELRFRFAGENRIRRLIGTVDARRRVECEFLMIIRPGRLETWECGSRVDHYVLK